MSHFVLFSFHLFKAFGFNEDLKNRPSNLFQQVIPNFVPRHWIESKALDAITKIGKSLYWFNMSVFANNIVSCQDRMNWTLSWLGKTHSVFLMAWPGVGHSSSFLHSFVHLHQDCEDFVKYQPFHMAFHSNGIIFTILILFNAAWSSCKISVSCLLFPVTAFHLQ